MKNWRKVNIIIVLFILMTTSAMAQAIKVSEKISDNQLTSYHKQKLILIDFWATWCAPCIPATKQLEIYQKTFKDDLYFISLSDENYQKIKDFSIKHQMQLAVYRDADNYTFEKYKVKARPHAVLLNTKGKLIWEGKPGDLSPELLKRFIRRYDSAPSVALSSLIEQEKQQLAQVEPVTAISIELCRANCNSRFIKTAQYIDYKGKLSELIAEIYGVSLYEVSMLDQDIDIHVKAPFSLWQHNRTVLKDELVSQFGIEILKERKELEMIELSVINKNRLWDTNQINWGEGSNRVLIGSDRIEADNLTINQVAKELSKEKKQLYKYLGSDNTPRDWSFHFLYDELMENELMDAFGIELKPISTTIEIITIK